MAYSRCTEFMRGRGEISMMEKIAVIGLGSTGSQALWHLSRIPGVEAIGFEQFGIAHGYGAYTGESRLFRTAYHEGTTYVPLLRRARELWLELGAASGRKLLHNFGVLSTGREDSASFQSLLRSVADHGLDHERLSAKQLRIRHPGMNSRDDEAGILDLQGGALRPELAVLSAIEQAQRHGAQVFEHTEITAIQDTGTGVLIQAGEREIMVDRVIITTGAWSSIMVPAISNLLDVRKLVLTWFLPTDPSDFLPGRMPCFIRDRDGFHIFGAPSVDGYSVKIAGLDLWGSPEDLRIENTDLRLERAQVSEFGRRVHELFPGVRPEPNRYSVHYDTYTANKVPIIDRTGDVVILTGGSGHGFKLAPVYAELAAHLAMGIENPLYSPDFTISAHEPVAETLAA